MTQGLSFKNKGFKELKWFYILTIIFSMLITSEVSNATNLIDSLEKLLLFKSGNSKVDIYNQLARQYTNENLLKSRIIAKQALQLAQSLQYQDGIAEALLNKANIEVRILNSDSLLGDLYTSLKIYESTKNKEGIANVKYAIGNCYLTKQEYTLALKLFNESIELYESIKSTANVAKTLLSVARVYIFWKMFDLSNETIKKAVDIYTRLNDQDGLAYIEMFKLMRAIFDADYTEAKRILTESSRIFEMTNEKETLLLYYRYAGAYYADCEKDYEKCRAFLNKSLKIALNINDKASIATILTHIGYTYLTQGNYQKDLEYNLQVLEMRKSVDWRAMLSSSYLNCGNDYFYLGDFDKAEEYYLNAVSISKEFHSKLIERSTYLCLNQLYLAKKDYEKANKFLLLSVQVNDTLVEDQKISHLNTIKNYHNLLESEKQKDLQKLKDDYKYSLILTISIFAFGLLLWLFLLYIKKRNINTNLAQRYRNVLENIQEALVIEDPDGRLLFANIYFCNLFGYKHNEITKLSLKDYIAPEYLTKVLDRHNKRCKGIPVPEHIEFEAIKKDGTRIWIEAKTSVITEKGKIIGTQSFEWDITDRKLMEESLRKSENKYRSLYENAQEGIFQTTIDGKYISVNPALAKIYGFDSPDELIKSVNDISQERYENYKIREDFVNIMLRDGFIKGFEYQVKKKDGSVIWLYENSNVVRDDHGNVKYFEGYVYDITEQKLAESTLVENEKQYRMLFEANPTPLIIYNQKNLSILEVNTTALDLYGYTIDEFKELTTLDIKVFEVDEELNKLAFQLTNEDLSSITKHRKKNGDIIYVEFVTHTLNWKGYYSELIAVIDVTERIKSQNELIAAKEKAEQANQLKTSFLSNISHELRTPLNGIMGFSEILEEISTNEEHLKMAEMINTSAKRLLDTLNLIIDLSIIEANKLERNITPVNFNELVWECANSFIHLTEEKGLYLNINITNDYLIILAENRILGSIINNLICNAIKFTNNGGIDVNLSTLTENEDNFAVLSVKDTGIGIDKGDYDKIFEVFRQVSEGLSRSFEGTGLGLSLTKKYVQLLNGKIEIESELGKGTEFRIILPLNEKQINEHELLTNITESNEITPTINSLHILLVEDDVINSEMTKHYLKNIGTVTQAMNAEEALIVAKQINFDLILMDINLGNGKSGADVAKILRSIDNYQSTPIIAVTAYSMYGDKEEFLEAGFSHYLSKPFSKDQLNKIIAEIINFS